MRFPPPRAPALRGWGSTRTAGTASTAPTRTSLEYCDDGFANDDPEQGLVSTQGTLATRYAVKASSTRSGLAIAVETLLADAKRLGIEFIACGDDTAPFLYYRGDGEHEDYPPPDGWRETLAAEAERIGFRSYQAADA